MNLTQAISLIVILVVLNLIFNTIAQRRIESSNINSQKVVADKEQKTKFSTVEKNFMAGIAILPLLMGLWAINYWFSEFNTARESYTWVAIQGKLRNKSVDSQHFRSDYSSSKSVTPLTYIPTVEYSFEYKGQTHIGTTLDYLNQPAYGDKRKVQEILDKLPDVGEEVTVYVSPDTSRAVLFRGTKDTSYFGILAGIPFFLAGLLGIKFIYGF